MDSFDETYSRAKPKAGKRKKQASGPDWLVSVCTAQLMLAAVGIALLLLTARFFPASFNSIKAEFGRIMQNDMSVSQIVSTVRSVLTPETVTEKVTEESSTAYEEESTVPEAAGGEDVEIYKATDTVCFAPLDTTVPICVPVQGRISSRFGYRVHPVTGEFGIHNGTDIAADEGTPIYAAFNGTVEETGYTSVRGNYIILSHGSNTQTIYLHCSEIVAPEGANVRSGEIIAKVGSTGRSTGPHLHFSIKVDGKYCNPEWLLDDV